MQRGESRGKLHVTLHGRENDRPRKDTLEKLGRWSSSKDDDWHDHRGHQIGRGHHLRDGNHEPQNTLRSERFWRACQAGASPNDTLARAGFEIEFQPDKERSVQEVTLRLNETWLTILQGVLDRKNG